jgi:hypothetical protein
MVLPRAGFFEILAARDVSLVLLLGQTGNIRVRKAF